MPIFKSKLNSDMIKHILQKKYNIMCIYFEKVLNSSANIFIIYTIDNQKYVLKEFQDGFDVSKIEREVLIVNYLRKYGIPTPIFVKTIDNEFFFSNNNNYLYLQRYIEGKTLNFHTSNYVQQAEMAKYYNEIVKLLKITNINFPNFTNSIFDKKRMEDNIHKFENLIDKTNNNTIIEMLYEKKNQLNKMIKKEFDELEKMSYVKSHGDYNVSQIIYDTEGHINGILDFASSKIVSLSWELFRSYIYMDPMYNKGNFNFDGLLEYLNVFNSCNLLNIYDLKNMFLVYYMYILNSSFGIEQYIFNNDINYLRIGQDLFNQCMFLNKNMTKLENKILLKKGDIIK